MHDKFIFLPCFSIEPNKISTFNKVFYRSEPPEMAKTHHDFKTNRTVKMKSTDESNTIKRAFHGFEISENAYRTLKRKINWLNYLAKPRKVTTYSGKTIYNFKCAFLTFTLPAAQLESTKDFTNKYFNQLLTELRTRLKMDNYVWRLEFQKNGNVHYHLVTDTYADYFFVLKMWNRILSKGHYIDDFHARFSGLSLSDYRNKVDPDHKQDFKHIAKRYAKGCKENWCQPPSVDVQAVTSQKAISSYLSKYFAKSADGNPIKNENDNAENSENLRLWFCSRSLSKLKTVTDFCEAVDFCAATIVEGIDKVKKVVFRYATVFYFEISQLPAFCKKTLALILKNYANEFQYKPAL